MPEGSGRHSQRDLLPSIDRLLALTDGVVAIALTLLVLQLRVPPLSRVADASSASDLAGQLSRGGDQLISYVISFYVIANFWLAHHRLFRELTGQRESLAWWNFAFLFTITLMPFTSDLLGQYASNPLAVDIFALNLLLATLSTQATLVLVRHRGLTGVRADSRAMRTGQARSVASVAIVSVSIPLAWVNTSLAIYSWLLIGVVPRVYVRWRRAREQPEDPPAGRPER